MQQNHVSMIQDLARSGLLPADMDCTENQPSAFAVGAPSPSYTIPYYLPDGTRHPFMHRLRYTPPPPGGGKYSQPSSDEIVKAGGTDLDATYPYLNPYILGGVTWAAIGAAAGKRLLIVEGEKKAVAAGKFLKRPVVGIGGCYQALVRNKAGIFVVHPVIAKLIQPGDDVEVVLDSDMFTNPSVNHAAGSTRRAFLRLGVSVRFVVLPSVGKRPVGLDDWIVSLPPSAAAAEYDALPRVDGTEGDGFAEDRASLFDVLGLVLSDKGTPIPTESNMLRVLKGYERYRLRLSFDVVGRRLWHTLNGGRPEQITDDVGYTETAFLQERLGVHGWRTALVTNGLYSACAIPELHRNRVLDELGPVVWDGTARLEMMFIDAFGAEDNEYHRMVGRNWLTSAVARLTRPGCQVDTMLVLEGNQGIGKSRALEIIGGCGYVAMQQEMETKDFILAAHSGWLADVVELGSLQYADMAYIKGMITTRTDSIRAPYGRATVDTPRRFVLVGTTNGKEYLRDDTGNRRFWPVACGKIDRDYLIANRAQLIAEALARLDAGLPWWEEMGTALSALVEAQQEARRQPDPWESTLGALLADHTTHRCVPASRTGGQVYFLASVEILAAMGVSVKDMTTANLMRLARVMKQFSAWEKFRYKNANVIIQLSTGGVTNDVMGYALPIVGVSKSSVVAVSNNKAVKY